MIKTKRFIFLHIVMYIAFAGFYGFYSITFKEHYNFTNTQLSIIFSAISIVSLIALPFWGITLDITKNYKKILLILFTVTAVFYFSIIFVNAFLPILLIFILLSFFREPMTTIVDDLNLNSGYFDEYEYGHFRKYGSLGFGVGALLIGVMLAYIDFPRLFLLISAVALVVSALILLTYNKLEKKTVVKQNFISNFKKLIKQKNYILIVIIAAISIALLDANMIYQSLRISELAGESYNNINEYIIIGATTFVMAFPEFFLMGVGDRLYNKLGTKKMLILALFLLGVRFSLYAFTNSLTIFIIATVLHSFTIVLVIPGALNYIKDNVDKNVSATAASILWILRAIIISIVIVVAGIISDTYSLKYVYILFLIVLLLPMILVAFIKSKQNSISV